MTRSTESIPGAISARKTNNTSRPTNNASRPCLPWRKINHLAGAFPLGVVLTATVFLTTPLGMQDPAPSDYGHRSEQPAQATSRDARQATLAAADQRAAMTPDGRASAADQPRPTDPQEQLRQIQAINDYDRRLTQPDIPGLPTDPAGTPLPPPSSAAVALRPPPPGP